MVKEGGDRQPGGLGWTRVPVWWTEPRSMVTGSRREGEGRGGEWGGDEGEGIGAKVKEGDRQPEKPEKRGKAPGS